MIYITYITFIDFYINCSQCRLSQRLLFPLMSLRRLCLLLLILFCFVKLVCLFVCLFVFEKYFSATQETIQIAQASLYFAKTQYK